MERKKYLFAGIAAALLVLFALPTQKVQAASLTDLKVNKTYKSYDVTGDNKKDTVKITAKAVGHGYTGASVYVNGKSAYKVNDSAEYYDVELIRLDNKKPFLFLYAIGPNGDGHCKVLQYKGGKFVAVINEQGLFGAYGNHSNAVVKEVKGNKVIMTGRLMSWSLTSMEFEIRYEYKKGTLRRVGFTEDLTRLPYPGYGKGYLEANRSITTYKKPGSTGSKAYTIKAGQKVYIKKVWLRSGKLWIQTTVNGKVGWFPASKKAYPSNNMLFKGTMYAG